MQFEYYLAKYSNIMLFNAFCKRGLRLCVWQYKSPKHSFALGFCNDMIWRAIAFL